ncbi:nickel transporter [Streptomyces sp. NBC_01261]|uniref:HoxN/HupN/NixA family nickel/cobalt transporter n=1 Tax=Streptomyces sp. NBC_01261 TaxID=2903802 RepID=UPI002E3470D1|nr:nickel transporter [Streptomyces sp. NBC_01261]
MNHTLRRATLTAASIALACACGLPTASAAPAHPLGNFTVNYHTGLTLRPDRIDATVVVDRAEISTLQEHALIDTDHDGTVTPDEARVYADAACPALEHRVQATVAGNRVGWTAVSSGLTYQRGQAGLKTSRLTCTATARADLSHPVDIAVRTGYDTRRIGWREMTVRGDGIRVTGTDLPAVSPTDELRHYPRDPAASPLNQHTARLHSRPGSTTATTPGSSPLSGPGWFTSLLDRTSAVFDSLVGARQLTLPIGLLALLLALVLGASHAMLPGHGKTIMASYLAGRRGTRRDAVTVGTTVTLTHTTGVLVLGLALPAATHLAGETVLSWLGAASGVIVSGIGLWLLSAALRKKPQAGHHHGHGHHHHDHGDHEHHVHDHVHLLPRRRTPHTPHAPKPSEHTSVATLTTPPDTTAVTPAHHHHHPAPRPTGRAGLIGMGIAGGLVPSPSALVVLLGAVALGRTAFGVLLVFAYGLGMAGTLTLVGLLLVRLRGHLEARGTRASLSGHTAVRLLSRIGPTATALLVIAVGLGLTVRAVTGAG